MPRLKFKKACKGCPFRRDSAAGWLGAGPPEDFVHNALSDYTVAPLPCHEVIDYSDPEWLTNQYPDAALCAGALIFCQNDGKMPRDPERAELIRSVEPDSDVFRHAQEFIDYHRASPIQSWRDPQDG